MNDNDQLKIIFRSSLQTFMKELPETNSQESLKKLTNYTKKLMKLCKTEEQVNIWHTIFKEECVNKDEWKDYDQLTQNL